MSSTKIWHLVRGEDLVENMSPLLSSGFEVFVGTLGKTCNR